MGKKRILVIDDDVTVQMTMAMVLRLQGYIVDTAGTGKEAIEKSNFSSYNLALIDFRLPDIEGTKLLTAMRDTTPRMVKIMLTGYPSDENRAEALERHADAYLVKPVTIAQLLKTVNEHLIRQNQFVASNTNCERPPEPTGELLIVAIGASAGGPKALERVLSKIPNDLPVALVISQHMPDGFTKPFAERLAAVSKLHVREAAAGDILRAGDALVAPAGFNMEVVGGGRIRLEKTAETPAPSIDVMMNSVAEAYGSRSIGVLLTGMLRDGVRGMKAIKMKGGITIVQDENSSVVYGMPKAALEAGAADVVADIAEIPNIIVNALTKTFGDGNN
jgi:two-component system chemotaxis response regulator CheB